MTGERIFTPGDLLAMDSGYWQVVQAKPGQFTLELVKAGPGADSALDRPMSCSYLLVRQLIDTGRAQHYRAVPPPLTPAARRVLTRLAARTALQAYRDVEQLGAAPPRSTQG